MKKIFTLIIGLCLLIIANAQIKFEVVLSDKQSNAEILENTNQKFRFTNTLSNFEVTQVVENEELYSKLIATGYYSSNKIGYPQLPVLTKIIEVPIDSKVVAHVVGATEKIVELDNYSPYPIVPSQPALFKNQKKGDVPFQKSESIYRDKNFYQTDLVSIEEVGIMRGVRMVKIIVSPFSYDIENNTITIKDNIEVEVTFSNGDYAKTKAMKENKYSHAFGTLYNSIWNYKEPATRNASINYPVKYVIVSDRMFEETLQPFIAWKAKKGFEVIVAYTDEIGTTTANIKTYLQGLYNAGTVENPAPSYVLFVGDVAQIPVWNSKLSGYSNDHITDVYSVCFDGDADYIPEMFFGRFSAQNVAQLVPQIQKTLMYEQYTFLDPDYLSNAVLVAGYDQTWSATHANGQANYVSTYYVNSDHNVNATTYLSPESHSSAEAIIEQISGGVGYVNYSAHCDQNGWQDPAFSISDIPGLENEGEYFFSVGNCCLSNKFDESECFGESLLRTEGKGAVCHIGGTNSTIWDEDFYWAVGVTASVTANPTYESTSQGMYDHLYHEHNEEPYITSGQMIFIGNMQVNSSTSTYIQYYWEIYTCMGDPSLMPYIGTPTNLVASYQNIIPIGTNSLTVDCEPESYLALSKEGILLDAVYTGNNNIATLNFDAVTESGTLDIVITKLFKKPHIQQITIIEGTNENDVVLQTILKPESSMSVIDATFQPEIVFMNIGTNAVTSATASYNFDNGENGTLNWNGNLGQYESDTITFAEITLQQGSYTFNAAVTQPNGNADEDVSNNSLSRSVLVSTGNATISSVLTPSGSYCGYPELTPEIVVKNNSSFAITSLICSYTSGNITENIEWTGNIASAASQIITFPSKVFPEGENTITFTIDMVNGGANSSESIKNSTFELSHSGTSFRFDFTADYYGEESTWDIKDNNNGIIYSGGPYSYGDVISEDFCINNGCYTFNLYDSGNNGLTGFYGIIATGTAEFTNTYTNETIFSDSGSESFEIKTTEFCAGETVLNENLENENISVYPNPTAGFISVSGIGITKIEILNNLGQIIDNIETSSNHNEINLSDFSNGMYYLKLFTEKDVKIEKITIRK